MQHGYEMDQRPVFLGGGWRVRLFEDGQEAGGASFPANEYLSEEIDAEEAEIMAYCDALDFAQQWANTTY